MNCRSHGLDLMPLRNRHPPDTGPGRELQVALVRHITKATV
jgi:hypothetical protein